MVSQIYIGTSRNIKIFRRWHEYTPIAQIEDGSSTGVYKENQIDTALTKCLWDKKYLAQMRQKMLPWQPDGHATNRIVQLIKNFINK